MQFSNIIACSFLLLLCVLVTQTLAITETFSSQDAARAQQAILHKQRSDGLFGEAAETHAALGSLNALAHKLSKSRDVCDKLQNQLNGAKELDDVYHLVLSLTHLQCGNIQLKDDQKSLVKKGLNSENLSHIYHSVMSLLALADKDQVRLNDYDFSEVIPHVAALAEEDGSFRTSKKSKQGTSFNGGLAFEVVGKLLSKVSSLRSKHSDDVKSVIEKVSGLLSRGGDEEDKLEYESSQGRSSLSVAAQVLVGLQALSAANEKFAFNEGQLNRFADFFISNKFVASPSEVYSLLRGLNVCADNNFHVPLVLSRQDNEVRVTNILGKFATSVRVVLKKAADASSPAKAVISDQTLAPASSASDNTAFQLDVSNLKKPGFYLLSFNAEPLEKQKKFKALSNVVHNYKVLGKINKAVVELSSTKSADGSDALKSDTKTSAHPNSFSGSLPVDNKQYLHVTIRIDGNLEPSQVFVQLTSSQNQVATFVVKKTDDVYALHLDAGSTSFTNSVFGSGDYTVEVIIGDALLSNSLHWKAGTVSLNIGKSTTKAATSPVTSGPLPEIKHYFRDPDSRPSFIISTIFTVVCLAPFALFIIGLGHLGGFKLKLPSTPSGVLYAFVFQLSIAAILLGIVLYWLFLNIFQAFVVLAAVSVVAVFSGNLALKAHTHDADAELQHKDKKD